MRAQSDICQRHEMIEGRKRLESLWKFGGDSPPRLDNCGNRDLQRRRSEESFRRLPTITESAKLMAPFDLEACIQQLLRKQLLHEALLREICEKTKEVLMRESNVVHISAPVTVVGDIHGFVIPRLPFGRVN